MWGPNVVCNASRAGVGKTMQGWLSAHSWQAGATWGLIMVFGGDTGPDLSAWGSVLAGKAKSEQRGVPGCDPSMWGIAEAMWGLI